MNFKVDRKELATATGDVYKAAGRGTVLPVLSNVLLKAAPGELVLCGTNLESAILARIPAGVEQEGAITVPASTLKALIGTLTGETVSMSLHEQSQTLHLECGASEAEIKGINAEEFPMLLIPDIEPLVTLNTDELAEAMSLVTLSVADDESRPMLTGVYVIFQYGQMTMAAADGFRLTVVKMNLNQMVQDTAVLVPGEAMQKFIKQKLGKDGQTGILVDDGRRIFFATEDRIAAAQLIDLQFPDYKQIVPKKWETKAVVDRKQLLAMCKAAKIFARDSAGTTRFHIVPGGLEPGRINITARSDETGRNSNRVEAVVEGPEIEIAFNIEYVVDILKVTKEERVAVELTKPGSPGVFRPVGNDDALHVVMPMHIGR